MFADCYSLAFVVVVIGLVPCYCVEPGKATRRRSRYTAVVSTSSSLFHSCRYFSHQAVKQQRWCSGTRFLHLSTLSSTTRTPTVVRWIASLTSSDHHRSTTYCERRGMSLQPSVVKGAYDGNYLNVDTIRISFFVNGWHPLRCFLRRDGSIGWLTPNCTSPQILESLIRLEGFYEFVIHVHS